MQSLQFKLSVSSTEDVRRYSNSHKAEFKRDVITLGYDKARRHYVVKQLALLAKANELSLPVTDILTGSPL